MNPFAAVSDATRRRIIEALATGPMASGEIAALFPVSASAVSQHLKLLKGAGLVRVRSEAQRRIYELDPEGVEALAGWAEGLMRHWNARLDALEARRDERK
jgi:DNA-binding transcriptional ArsR family regulator